MSLIETWEKTTIYKLFGLTLFEREEFFNGSMRNPDLDIVIRPDYYNQEFKMERRKND